MNKPITHKENFPVITDFYLNWKKSIHVQIKTSKVQCLFFLKIDISLIFIFQYNLSLSPFFPNFWGVGLGTLSNSLFFGDPQNSCWDRLLKSVIIFIFYWVLDYVYTVLDSFCAGTKTIPDRASVYTHKNRDFGAISVTERSCATPISKVESHISDSCSYHTG